MPKKQLTPASWEAVLLPEGPPPRLTGLAPLLLAWYRENARRLPWRREPEVPIEPNSPGSPEAQPASGRPPPYHVWVSEIMLQQTRVEAVKGYYARFLAALPTVADLAEAPADRLLKLWEGLGYYNRARNLQRAAQAICRDHGGVLPASYAGLLALPGIGEYTAGAIASIAFGIPVPAVDGNVYRVLSRVLGSWADTSRPAVKRAFRELAGSLLPEEYPGDFNQALMELGALVCAPGGPPLCGRCPLEGLCAVSHSPAAGELPVKAAKKARRVEERTVLFLIARGKVLLERREEGGLLPEMFQPLNLEGRLDKEEAAGRLRALGAAVDRLVPLQKAKHIFSHVEWHMQGYLAYAPPFDYPGGVWADGEQLRRDLALPSAFSAYTRDLPLWLQSGGREPPNSPQA